MFCSRGFFTSPVLMSVSSLSLLSTLNSQFLFIVNGNTFSVCHLLTRWSSPAGRLRTAMWVTFRVVLHHSAPLGRLLDAAPVRRGDEGRQSRHRDRYSHRGSFNVEEKGRRGWKEKKGRNFGTESDWWLFGKYLFEDQEVMFEVNWRGGRLGLYYPREQEE